VGFSLTLRQIEIWLMRLIADRTAEAGPKVASRRFAGVAVAKLEQELENAGLVLFMQDRLQNR